MKQMRRTIFFLAAAMFLMLFIACGGGGSSSSTPIPPPQTQYVTVPNVVGMTESTATTSITSAGFTVTKTRSYSTTVPSGNVISQSPSAQTSAIKSSPVNLIISLGPEEKPELATVPNVVGMTESAATTAITSAELTVGVTTSDYSATVPLGHVISQYPEAVTPVDKLSPVDLVISLGPEEKPELATVPNVVGMTESAATTAITSAELTVGVTTSDYSATVPLGHVISQDPAAGTHVDKLSPVDLVLSLGPAASTNPDPFKGQMTFVENMAFFMGCTAEQGGDCLPTEEPAHLVTSGAFYIGKYAVTQAQWKAVMGVDNNPSCFKGDDLPVECASWNDVQEFITELNAQTLMNYRLPTEAEWECAARGGDQSQGYKYSGSDDPGEIAWYDANSKNTTNPVGTKKANELGIYDMSGNVWEWVSDWYGDDYYSSSPPKNPQGPASGECGVFDIVGGVPVLKGFAPGECHVLRGGSWANDHFSVRVSNRYFDDGPSARYADIGFRLARDAD